MYAMAVEELSKACGTTRLLFLHTSLGSWLFLSSVQKHKNKNTCKDGKWRMDWSFRIDRTKRRNRCRAGQQTIAILMKQHKNEFINGSKIFITNAGYAHVYVIFAYDR